MILVLLECEGGDLSEVSLETLTLARSTDAPVTALLVGEALVGLDKRLGEYGVTTALQADGEAFSAYAPAAWAAAVVTAAGSCGAAAVTAAGTPRGNEVLAHVACRLGVGMAANVVTVESTSPYVVRRQVLGGSALEEMRLDAQVAVFSVAGHACDPTPASATIDVAVQAVEVPVSDRDLAVRVVASEAAEADGAGSLKSAKVVVGAGRGAGGADGFGDLLELAELLGGSLGVSRVVTSLGWRPHHEQVGQTGSRISPDLYIPCGISGAIQHWAGCSSAKTILAINTDPDAPMVTKAHYAVIGDLHEVVPAIVQEMRRRRG